MRLLRFLSRRLVGERGQSVIEALMAVAVLGIAAETTAVLVQTMAKQTVANRDRAFATEKALQMLEELRQLVLTDSENLDTFQDTYSDGYCNTCTPPHPNFKWTLTTKYDVTNDTATGTVVPVPDWQSAMDPHSDNPVRPGSQGYAFCRYISITPSATDPNVRDIYVRVYAAAPNPGPVSSNKTALPLAPNNPPLAEVYGVVHSSWNTPVSSQVLDLYLLSLENVPGWWTRPAD
ncbi:MAG: type IV pilus modification PilV family protein, partial [bacterium]